MSYPQPVLAEYDPVYFPYGASAGAGTHGDQISYPFGASADPVLAAAPDVPYYSRTWAGLIDIGGFEIWWWS